MLATTVLLLGALLAPGEEAVLGQPAPALGDLAWLEGEPVTAYEPGRVYVLDFWATWCTPCIYTIPHLSAVAEEYREAVTVIGIGVGARPGAVPIAEFFAEHGADMDYIVAEDVDDANTIRFLSATGSEILPVCMIVDKQGRLAWIGHPLFGFDRVLARIVADEYDTEAETAAMLAAEASWAEVREQVVRLESELAEARQAEDWARVLDLTREAVALHPYAHLANMHVYIALVAQGEGDEAAQLARDLLADTWIDDSEACNNLARAILESDSGIPAERRDLDLALAAAQQAVALTHERIPVVIETLARVHFERGELQAAVDAQRRAVDLADENERPALEPQLREYESAQQASER